MLLHLEKQPFDFNDLAKVRAEHRRVPALAAVARASFADSL